MGGDVIEVGGVSRRTPGGADPICAMGSEGDEHDVLDGRLGTRHRREQEDRERPAHASERPPSPAAAWSAAAASTRYSTAPWPPDPNTMHITMIW